MKPETKEQKTSYALGMNVATQVANLPVTLDVEAFLAGVSDLLAKRQPQLSRQEFSQLINEITDEMEKKRLHSEGHCGSHDFSAIIKAGEEYRKANAAKPGVTVTASGLQIEHLREGSGASPKATDKVRVHYTGTLIDGTVFDSSVERGTPLEFPLNRVIPGWTEGLQLMKVGGKARLTIPPQLGYGAWGSGDAIPPHATLVFDVELLDIK